jgi:hypothetical protein
MNRNDYENTAFLYTCYVYITTTGVSARMSVLLVCHDRHYGKSLLDVCRRCSVGFYRNLMLQHRQAHRMGSF